MEFKEHLNDIFENMDFTNASVARHGGPDASLISRFRTGDRMPSGNGKQLKRLCRGMVALAKEKNCLNDLSKLCNLSGDSDDENKAISELFNWLESMIPSNEKKGIEEDDSTQRLYAFSDKLDALMEVFDISNIRLARALHIDASLVSRFRTGMRMPTADSWFPKQCCYWIAERALSLSDETRMKKLQPFLGHNVPSDLEKLSFVLLKYMEAESETMENILTDTLLDRLNAFKLSFKLPQELVDTVLEAAKMRHKKTESYYGINGLREAVKQFLSVGATATKPNTLYLYSNQPMNWMSDDPEFSKIWMVLMGIILKNGHQIRIIHNIDRSMPEMFDAIQKWIPLYMTGQIQSYYCEKKAERFYQTKFILPGLCSVDANMVAGTEDQAEYLFCTDSERINYHMHQFNALLTESLPLLRIFKLNNLKAYENYIAAVTPDQTMSKYLRSTLSLATMPKEVFESIAKRTIKNEETKRHLKRLYTDQVRIFQKELKEGGVMELIPLCPDEKLFNLEVRTPFPASLVGKEVCYHEEEYVAHIQEIHRLLKIYESYRFCFLPTTPFENVEVMIRGEKQTFVLKMDEPVTAFLFEHPVMTQAFSEYIQSLAQKVMPGTYSRNVALESLIKYLD